MEVDLQQITEGAGIVKTIFETLRQGIAFWRDARNKGDTETEAKALDDLENQTRLAEAQIAQLLGYELCRCEFPPIPMLKVGHRDGVGRRELGAVVPVYECPKCFQTTAGSWGYTRQVAERGRPRTTHVPVDGVIRSGGLTG